MEINKVAVKNFKRVEGLELDLADITYLVGGNNSGKSSVLQAVHMAVSCAQRANELQQQVIAESSLRYCPTGDFSRLGNSGPYENRSDGSRGVIEFFGKTNDEADASYRVEIYKARNYHNIGVERSGVYPGFGQLICDPKELFSVYVPGLAGIPHHEEMQSYASVFRKAAGGEANLVFRNILRLIKERGKLQELEALLFDIIGPCNIQVNFDPDRDLYVEVRVSFSENSEDATYVAIDLSGTGVIQVTQILAYVILFGPKLLLVDEPDSHLHPSRQSLLSTAFRRIVDKYKCKIIVSTHSRHLISSAPDGATLVWLRNGAVEAQEDNGLAAMLLDLGALDQIDKAGADILICTEDKGKRALELCSKAAKPKSDIKVISYNGVTNAASAAVIQSMADLFNKKPRIIVHRDRDFLTDAELEIWSKPFVDRGMEVFCPVRPDVESYFVGPEHVALVYDAPLDDVKATLSELRDQVEAAMRGKFKEKRRDINLKYWRDGGGPATNTLWPEGQPMTPDTMLGKDLVPKINDVIGKKYGGAKQLSGKVSTTLTEELKKVL